MDGQAEIARLRAELAEKNAQLEALREQLQQHEGALFSEAS